MYKLRVKTRIADHKLLPTIEIDMKAWRVLAVRSETDFVNIVTSDFNVYRIFNTTSEEIFDASLSGKDLDKTGKYMTFMFFCKKCGGCGFVDWVQNIRRKDLEIYPGMAKSKYKKFYEKFERRIDKGYLLTFTDKKDRFTELYYSVGKIDESVPGSKICSDCLGTGFYNFAKSSSKESNIKKIKFRRKNYVTKR